MLEQLVTKKVNAIQFKYNKETKLYFNHVEEIWEPKIDYKRTELPKYDKYRTWSVHRLNDYIELLFNGTDVMTTCPVLCDKKTEKSTATEVKKKFPYVQSKEGKFVYRPVLKTVKGNRWVRSYNDLVETLHQPTVEKFTDIKFTLPYNLQDYEIEQALLAYREETQDEKFEIDVDYAKAILNTILVTYSQYKSSIKKDYHYGVDKKYHERVGFVQCSWNLLRHTCTNKYPKYLKALINANIVECDNVYMNWGNNKKALSYRINDKFFEEVNTGMRINRTCEIRNYHIKYTLLKYKIDYREKQRNTSDDLKTKLMDEVEELISPIDIEAMANEIEENKLEFYNVENEEELEKKLKKSRTYTISDLKTSLQNIQAGNIYFNPSDEFGGRFHSPFTNLKSVIRKYVSHEGSKYMNIDICNSQMTILTAIMDRPDVAKKLLKDVQFTIGGDELKDKIIDAVEIIKNVADVKDFCDKTKNGIIYETIAEYLGISRQEAKVQLLSVIFSNEEQFKHLRAKLGEKYPSLIDLANLLNVVDGYHYLPMICQRFESQLFINTIVREFFKHKKHPIITIHDSVMIHPDDYEIFMLTYKHEFTKLGLEPFKVKCEMY